MKNFLILFIVFIMFIEVSAYSEEIIEIPQEYRGIWRGITFSNDGDHYSLVPTDDNLFCKVYKNRIAVNNTNKDVLYIEKVVITKAKDENGTNYTNLEIIFKDNDNKWIVTFLEQGRNKIYVKDVELDGLVSVIEFYIGK